MSMKHSKVITTESYHEKLSSYKQEVQQTIRTNGIKLTEDVIACLQHILLGDTPELTIHISRDKITGEPNFVTKTWITKKEYYGKG